MKLTHKIIKIVFSLCVIFLGQNVLGQRLISIYEPMYTYDYSLKLSLSAAVNEITSLNYYQIENFKAPIGVKFIFDKYDHGTQVLYVYNPETGYLIRERHHQINEQGIPIPNTSYIIIYEYSTNDNDLIIQKRNLSKNFLIKQYFFDKQKEVLNKTIVENSTYYYSHTDEIVPNYYTIDNLKIKYDNGTLSEYKKIKYEITTIEDSLFKDTNNPFIYINEYIPLREFGNYRDRDIFITSKSNYEKEASRIAKSFNSQVKKYVSHENNNIKLNFYLETYSEQNKIEKRESHDLWITSNTITKKFKNFDFYLFDTKTKQLVTMNRFGSRGLREERFNRPVYKYTN